jgi:UPF0271 protein
MQKIDLNCDMGESTSLWPYNINNDISLLPYISSINLACGYHAGDQDTATKLMKEAFSRDIAVGAHPSFPDRKNFGREAMCLDEKDLYRTIYEQLAFIASLAISNGMRVQHVKLHGALYNMAATDHRLAFIVCSAVQSYDEDLIIYGLSGSEIIKVAGSMGLRSCNEVFADRTYDDNGSLTPRTEQEALIEDEEQCKEQVLNIIKQGTVCTTTGKNIPLKVDTICIHSDGGHSFHFAKLIHETLHRQGIKISHP